MRFYENNSKFSRFGRLAATGLGVAGLACMASAAMAAEPGPTGATKVEHPLPLKANQAGVYGLEHTHVITGNIENCIHFYVDLLGFTQATAIRDMPDNKAMQVMLGVPNAHFRHVLLNMPGGPSFGDHVPQIEVWEITNSKPLDTTLQQDPAANLQGKGYNAYRVVNLAVIVKRLKAAGIRFVSDPVWPGKTVGGVYVVDPDGQLVELDQYDKSPH